MKTLAELCKPRDEVFKNVSIEDTQELRALLENEINPYDFFDKTFITNSMKQLFDKAFARFTGHDTGSGLVILKQAMGGGKTHSMIALGLLAKYPDCRKKILGENYKYWYDGEIKVVGFTGRSTRDIPWIEIAKQLNRTNVLSEDIIKGIAVPGDTEWCRLLGNEPLLILLDEIPFYFQANLTVPKGNGTMADFVSMGLANLFNALNSSQLSRVFVVIADLEAKYEWGGNFINNAIAMSLKDEAERTAELLRPVDIGSPEIYEILRKKLFKEYPQNPETDPDVLEIVAHYKEFLKSLQNAGIISDSFDDIATYLKKSFPFHPGIINLFKNFQNNLRFQQTRGLLRLIRRYVQYLYSGDDAPANKKSIIMISDYNLDDPDTETMITNINPELHNALVTDIHATSGLAKAQIIDRSRETNLCSKFAKAILFASLSSTDINAVGLTDDEIFAYTLEPGDDISKAKDILEEYWSKTTFSRETQNGKKYFSYNENVVAMVQEKLADKTYEIAEAELTRILREFYTPRDRDCYQAVYQRIIAMPSDLRSIPHSTPDAKKNVTLIISKPCSPEGKLNEHLENWWLSEVLYKNRFLFLTGVDRYYRNLLDKVREYMSWDEVVAHLENENVRTSDPEYRRAVRNREQVAFDLIQNIKNTFNKLYYPHYDIYNGAVRLECVDIDYSSIPTVEQQTGTSSTARVRAGQTIDRTDDAVQKILRGNNRDGEVVIRKTLEQEKYLSLNPDNESDMQTFKQRFLLIIIGQESQRASITIDELERRMATNPRWFWHKPDFFEKFVKWMCDREEWQQEGNTIILKVEKKPVVEVYTQQISYNFDTDEITIPLSYKNGDTVYWAFGDTIDIQTATKLDDPSKLTVKPGKNTKFTFVCVDSERNIQGDPVTVEVPVKATTRRTIDSQDRTCITVKSLPEVDIYYTTDGSSPVNSGIKLDGNEIVVDPREDNVKEVRVVAQSGTNVSHVHVIKIDTIIDPDRPVKYSPNSNNQIRFRNMTTLKSELAGLQKYKGKVVNLRVDFINTRKSENVTVMMNNSAGYSPESIEQLLSNINQQLFGDRADEVNIGGDIRVMYFEKGKDFIEWIKEKGKNPEDCKEEIEQNE